MRNPVPRKIGAGFRIPKKGEQHTGKPKTNGKEQHIRPLTTEYA